MVQSLRFLHGPPSVEASTVCAVEVLVCAAPVLNVASMLGHGYLVKGSATLFKLANDLRAREVHRM
jgi:hypothetical protein